MRPWLFDPCSQMFITPIKFSQVCTNAKGEPPGVRDPPLEPSPSEYSAVPQPKHTFLQDTEQRVPCTCFHPRLWTPSSWGLLVFIELDAAHPVLHTGQSPPQATSTPAKIFCNFIPFLPYPSFCSFTSDFQLIAKPLILNSSTIFTIFPLPPLSLSSDPHYLSSPHHV